MSSISLVESVIKQVECTVGQSALGMSIQLDEAVTQCPLWLEEIVLGWAKHVCYLRSFRASERVFGATAGLLKAYGRHLKRPQSTQDIRVLYYGLDEYSSNNEWVDPPQLIVQLLPGEVRREGWPIERGGFPNKVIFRITGRDENVLCFGGFFDEPPEGHSYPPEIEFSVGGCPLLFDPCADPERKVRMVRPLVDFGEIEKQVEGIVRGYRQTFRHEFLHLMDWMFNLEPWRRFRQRRTVAHKLPHQEREVEVRANLGDEIDRFVDQLRSGALSVDGVRQELGGYWGFWKAWKEKDPARYRRMVGIVWSELARLGCLGV